LTLAATLISATLNPCYVLLGHCCSWCRAEWLEVNQSSDEPAVGQVAAAYEALAALLSPAQVGGEGSKVDGTGV
jgi:hypothetical protein